MRDEVFILWGGGVYHSTLCIDVVVLHHLHMFGGGL